MAAIFAACLVIYVPTANAASGDVQAAYAAAWQVTHDGSTELDSERFPYIDNLPTKSTETVGEFGGFDPTRGLPYRENYIVKNAHGDDAIGRSPGVIAAALPAYAIARTSSFTPTPGALTAAAATSLAVALLFGLLRRHLTPSGALLATVIFAFATPVWSLAADGVWPHTLTSLGIIGMAWAADRDRWWLVGLFGGIALWGRLHSAVICALVGLGVAVSRRKPSIALRVAATSLLLLAGTCVWTRWFYGTWRPTAGYDAGAYAGYARDHLFDVLNVTGMFVSPDRGILVWTPLIVLLAPALWRSWRQLPDWSRHLLLAGIAYTLIQAVFNRYSGGSTFWPYRLTMELLCCATPALAISVRSMASVERRILPHVSLVQAALIVPGAFDIAFTQEISSDRPELLIQSVTVAVLGVLWAALLWWARRAVQREAHAAGSQRE